MLVCVHMLTGLCGRPQGSHSKAATANPSPLVVESVDGQKADARKLVNSAHFGRQVPEAAAPRRSFLEDQLDGDTALRVLLDASLETFNTHTRCPVGTCAVHSPGRISLLSLPIDPEASWCAGRATAAWSGRPCCVQADHVVMFRSEACGDDTLHTGESARSTSRSWTCMPSGATSRWCPARARCGSVSGRTGG